MTATLAVLCLVSSAAAAPLEVATVKVYLGPDGQALDVARLKPVKDKRALVRLRAANSDIDGLVLAGTVTEQGDFVTRIHGADWALVRLSDGRAAVSAPGIKPFDAQYKDIAKDGLGEELALAHATQTESGQLVLLAKKEFPHLVRKYEAQANTALVSLNKTCGTTLSFAFRWATFSDDDLAERDVWSLCEPLLNAALKHCRALGGLSQLTCQRGEALDLSRTGSALTFTTTDKGQSAGSAFVGHALEKP